MTPNDVLVYSWICALFSHYQRTFSPNWGVPIKSLPIVLRKPHRRSQKTFKVSIVKVFMFLFRLIPRVLILFCVVIVSLVWVITNGFVSLSSFSVCLSLVYMKATDASILILYPVTLLKACIISRSFLLKSVEPFKYRITLTSNRDTFIFYLIHFIFSSSAISLVKNNHHIKQMWKDWKSLSYP